MKTPFSTLILVFVCTVKGLRKCRCVARDDIKPPRNTGYKSIIITNTYTMFENSMIVIVLVATHSRFHGSTPHTECTYTNSLSLLSKLKIAPCKVNELQHDNKLQVSRFLLGKVNNN